MSETLLNVQNIVKRFGGLVALNDCTIDIEEGSITGIIGPNGSGKSTLFNVITGHLKPESGSVLYNGENITGDYGTLDTKNNSYKIKSNDQKKVKALILNNEQ